MARRALLTRTMYAYYFTLPPVIAFISDYNRWLWGPPTGRKWYPRTGSNPGGNKFIEQSSLNFRG